ncbi:QRFP-like peptide receptor isoform X2 [Biomphalaria glabrata]|uniref:QRFP-like peptide receptor isoform X2 n=1 Tax=Biomphalaria glabrata TaxID=6526 RepID=A0A9W2ZNT1_BIOGL|nr:QRFP-like peptide receptor isoform X2 [Biomphalaria glabrata]
MLKMLPTEPELIFADRSTELTNFSNNNTDLNETQFKLAPSSSLSTATPLIDLVTTAATFISWGTSEVIGKNTTYATTAKRSICGVSYNIDVSRVPYPRSVSEASLWEVVVKCLLVGALMLMAVVGNLLIIVIVSTSKKMKTTTNYYIVNLAVADLLVACFPMWIYVIADVTEGWILGGFLCKFNAFVQTSAITAISLTMMAIAGDRFFAIVYPLKARVTQRKVRLVVFFVWVCSLAIAVPPLIVYNYYERRWSNYLETFCHDIWPARERSDGSCDQGIIAERVYWAVVISVLNWIPMVMMTINYAVIIHRLHSTRVVSTNSGSLGMSIIQRRSAKKVVKMLFILLLTFIVCTVPFQVVTIYENYKDRITKLPSWYHPVFFTAVTLMYAHSGINPVMYGAMNQTFQEGFKQLLRRIGKHKRKSSQAQGKCTALPRPRICVVNNGKIDLDFTSSISHLIESKSSPTTPYKTFSTSASSPR